MSREQVLSRVRAALGVGNGSDAARVFAVAERLAHPPQHPRPAFAHTEGEARVQRLIACLENQGTEVVAIDGLAALPGAVAALLDRTPASSALVGEDRGGGDSTTLAVGNPPTPNPSPQGGGGPARLVVADDERLAALAWWDGLRPERWQPGQTLGEGWAALTHAWGAVAETGTLVLASGAANPASLAFLPELHIVALARADIAASFEDAFVRLSGAAAARMPRAVNLVSGASRTGDIGGKIVKGAHGPRSLAVILYGGPAAAEA